MRSMAGVLEGVSVAGIVKPKGREAGDDFVCVCVGGGGVRCCV